jgi:hypothetical protein
VETYDNIIQFEFVRLALETFWTEWFVIDERPVGTFDMLDGCPNPNDEYNSYKCITITHLSSPPIPQHAW